MILNQCKKNYNHMMFGWTVRARSNRHIYDHMFA